MCNFFATLSAYFSFVCGVVIVRLFVRAAVIQEFGSLHAKLDGTSANITLRRVSGNIIVAGVIKIPHP